jgi:hypothetical protein
MKKLVFVIVVLIGIMSSQLIYAEESCGVATAQHNGQYAWIIKCKSGRQFSCDLVGSEDGTGWECECDNGPCKGRWNFNLNEAAQTSCCSAENQTPVSEESNIKSEEKVKMTKKITKKIAKETTKLEPINIDAKKAETIVNKFFAHLDKSATSGPLGLGGSKLSDGVIFREIVESAEKGGINLLAGAMVYTLFELHINDELSCAVTVEEAKELKDMKDAAYAGGGAAMMNFLRDPLNSPNFNQDTSPENKEAVKKSCNNVLQAIPLIKKMYMKHPDRKHCRR